MSSLYQPPLTPGFNAGYSPAGGNNATATTKSPFFSIANQFIPRNLHDVIRWARFITSQSPVTTEVIRKLATYPITDFNIDTPNESIRRNYKGLFKSLELKASLHDIGFEFHTLGNVFVSVYFPIHRSLVCPHCAQSYAAKAASFAKFNNFQFEGECPSCGIKGQFKIVDTKSYDINKISLIKWDPTHIAVNHNPITDEYDYYYKIPNGIKRKIQLGDRLFVDSVPWSFVEAAKNNQDFKFDRNNIFHLKNLSTGQLVEGVSVPPLISQYSLVFYQQTLRKANESVAQDYMAPMRVIYPTAQTANSDPIISMSMRNFVTNMQQALVKHKQDNNHILIAPVPIGYSTVSGEGKTLLVSQEIAQAEESILMSLGVSRELLSGTTNWTSSTVGLRMLENTLTTYTGQMERLIEWVMERTTKYLNWETHAVTLVPFKLTDDEGLRQMLLQLYSQGKASVSTLLESYGIDYEDELKKIREDTLQEAISQAQMGMEIDRGVFLATKKSMDKFDSTNDYRTALAKAQQMAEELHQTDPNTCRQVLNQLKIEDYAMYLMVSKLIDEISTQMNPEVGPDGQPVQGQEAGQDPSQAGQAAKSPGEAGQQKPSKPAGKPAASEPKQTVSK